MSIENLESIFRPVELETSGVEKKMHILNFNEYKQPRGDFEIKKMLQKVFSIKSFEGINTIMCWYDVLRGGDPEHYLNLNGVYMVGVFYTKEGGHEKVTHFFVRKLEDWRGSLDQWKDDVRFPSGTRAYSVCAILPKGFEMPERGLRDPHNHAVTQFTWERIEEMGISMLDILDYITYAGFTKV